MTWQFGMSVQPFLQWKSNEYYTTIACVFVALDIQHAMRTYRVKIRPVGAELFHSDRRIDGQTNMTKLIVTFRNFANAPNKMCRCKANHTLQPGAYLGILSSFANLSDRPCHI